MTAAIQLKIFNLLASYQGNSLEFGKTEEYHVNRTHIRTDHPSNTSPVRRQYNRILARKQIDTKLISYANSK
jgi:hypothetical protein